MCFSYINLYDVSLLDYVLLDIFYISYHVLVLVDEGMGFVLGHQHALC